jgi:hypothetical protein
MELILSTSSVQRNDYVLVVYGPIQYQYPAVSALRDFASI